MFEFAKEMQFDERGHSNKKTRDRSLMRLPISPAIIASGISTIFLPENFKELCDRFELLLQEKQTGKSSNIIIGRNIGIADKLLEYKSISTKQHKLLQLFF